MPFDISGPHPDSEADDRFRVTAEVVGQRPERASGLVELGQGVGEAGVLRGVLAAQQATGGADIVFWAIGIAAAVAALAIGSLGLQAPDASASQQAATVN